MFAIVYLLSISVALKAFDEPQLLQVLILIRSTDRAPLYEFSSAESAMLFPRGLGEVTNEGLRRASQQGEAFKQRYVALGLLKEQSEEQRVLIIRNSMEHRCKVLARHNISHDFCDPNLLIAEYIKMHPDCADFPYSRIEAALAEVENPDVRLETALAKCARGSGGSVQFRSLSIRSAIGDDLDPDRLRTVIGPLISILSKHIDDVVRSELIEGVQMDASVRIYVTHDHVLLAVAHVLGILLEYKGRNPQFSSAIAIETWHTSEGFDIKIIVKDGSDSAFQQISSYRYHDFKKLISPYMSLYQTNVQWDEHVKTEYTIQNFENDLGPECAWHKNQWSTMAAEILLLVIVAYAFVICFQLKENTRRTEH